MSSTKPHSNNSHKETAIAFLRLVASGKVRDAYSQYVDENFRHHNAYFRGDRESLMQAMAQNARENPNKVLPVKHALGDGEPRLAYSDRV